VTAALATFSAALAGSPGAAIVEQPGGTVAVIAGQDARVRVVRTGRVWLVAIGDAGDLGRAAQAAAAALAASRGEAFGDDQELWDDGTGLVD
jgi:hypothetical protein